MQLSKTAINEFKKIHFEEFKIALTDEEANKEGVQLLKLIKMIYRPIPVQASYKHE